MYLTRDAVRKRVHKLNIMLDVHPMNAVSRTLAVRWFMPRASDDNAESSRILLGLLDAVEQDRAQSQRHLAAELGIALGLVNAYLKRCIKKGLVKVRETPARRYAYYLTPQGFAEKSRLTVDYLSRSFGFFRQAKNDCSELLQAAAARGVRRIVLAGQSDLAEIAALCTTEHKIEIVALVQPGAAQRQFAGLPMFPDYESVGKPFDCVLVTSVTDANAVCEAAVARFGADRVLVPGLLRVRMKPNEAAE
jgi:DNA-binding MarR family transcriptional regulator